MKAVPQKKTPPPRKKPLTKQEISQIAAAVNNGEIKLPDITLEHDSDWVALWSLVDSGSSICGINCDKFLPGAKITESKAQRNKQMYAAAHGGLMANKGETTIHAKTEQGNVKTITWQNVDLDMPILSTHYMTKDGQALLYGHEHGLWLDPKKNTADNFISHGDVYFMKLYVPKHLTTKDPVFSGPGVA